MFNVISLGAGVQSSTMALMAAHGDITPMPDCAIFADTQSEPSAVYRYLDWLEGQLPFPIHRVTAGSLREVIMAATRGEQRMDARPPFYVAPKGLLKRQCTQDYKLLPIQRKLRELIVLRPRQRWPKKIIIEQWIGISTDEVSRAKPATVRRKVNGTTILVPHPSMVNRHPLLDMGMSRSDCLAWIAKQSYPCPPKSACTFCPYHDNATWATLQRDDPEAFADAVAVDRAIRRGVKDRSNGKPLNTGEWFVHRSMQPLDQVDFTATKGDKRQINLFENECEGMCGV